MHTSDIQDLLLENGRGTESCFKAQGKEEPILKIAFIILFVIIMVLCGTFCCERKSIAANAETNMDTKTLTVLHR